MLNKEFKRKDVDRARNLIRGKTGDSSEIQIGYTKKAGKLFKGQTVDVKARNSAEAIKKGIKQMKGDPALVPSDSVDAVLGESTAEYAKSLEKIANDRKMKNISKKDKETLIKIAQLMKTANEEK